MAARRFMKLAENAPTNFRTEMTFHTPKAMINGGWQCGIEEFLNDLDPEKLFKNVDYWQGAVYTFHITAISQRLEFIDRDIVIRTGNPLINQSRKDIKQYLLDQFDKCIFAYNFTLKCICVRNVSICFEPFVIFQ
jgi:hypothetical protein